MATPGSPGPARPAAPAAAPAPTDWPTQATDQIIRVVDRVRDQTTGPALSAARWIIYGTVIFLLLTPLFVVTLVGLMRACEAALEALGIPEPMWIVYLFFGSLFTLGGLLLWRQSSASPNRPRHARP